MWSDKPVQEPPTAAAERSAGLCVCQQQTGEQQLNASKTQSQVELSHLRYPGTDCLGQGSNLRGVLNCFRDSAAVGDVPCPFPAIGVSGWFTLVKLKVELMPS